MWLSSEADKQDRGMCEELLQESKWKHGSFELNRAERSRDEKSDDMIA